MARRIRGAEILGWLLLLAAACGGQKVRPLSIYDARLPPDSRRWVADADDQIVVAGAWRDEMHAAFDEALRWKEEVVAKIEWPAKGESAKSALEALAETRLDLAKLERDKADAEYELTLAKWRRVMAKTAMRHDIAIYDLEPIEDAVKQRRAHVQKLAAEIEQKQLELEKVESAWWKAFAAYVKAGGRGDILWVRR